METKRLKNTSTVVRRPQRCRFRHSEGRRGETDPQPGQAGLRLESAASEARLARGVHQGVQCFQSGRACGRGEGNGQLPRAAAGGGSSARGGGVDAHVWRPQQQTVAPKRGNGRTWRAGRRDSPSSVTARTKRDPTHTAQPCGSPSAEKGRGQVPKRKRRMKRRQSRKVNRRRGRRILPAPSVGVKSQPTDSGKATI